MKSVAATGQKWRLTWFARIRRVSVNADFQANSADYAGNKPITNGQWHSLCAVYDRSGGVVQLFVDGVLDASYITSLTSLATTNELRIGVEREGVNFFNGAIDNFRIYNRALSTNEVFQLYANEAKTFLTDGLVAYFPFNGNANDASGNGHNATAQNTFITTNQFGQANSALGFSGNGFVSVPYSPALATTNFTVSLVFNAQASFNTFCLLRSGGASSDFYRGYELNSMDGQANFGFWAFDGTPSYGADKCVTPIGNWQQDMWYHLTFTQSGLNSTLYLNGVVIAANTNSTPYAPAQSSDFFIGSNTGFEFLTGIICDVRFYNRGLSSSEVQQLHDHELTPSSASLSAVQLSFSNLTLGRSYQLQVSGNLVNWTNQDSAFIATGSDMAYPQPWSTGQGGRQFFRLQVVP